MGDGESEHGGGRGRMLAIAAGVMVLGLGLLFGVAKLVSEPSPSLVVTVVTDDRPLEGAEVLIRRQGGPTPRPFLRRWFGPRRVGVRRAQATTGRDGSVRFTGLQQGRYDVTATHPEGLGSSTHRSMADVPETGGTTASVSMSLGVRLRFRFGDGPGGEDLAVSEAWVMSRIGERSYRGTTPEFDANTGIAESQVLTPGPVVIWGTRARPGRAIVLRGEAVAPPRGVADVGVIAPAGAHWVEFTLEGLPDPTIATLVIKRPCGGPGNAHGTFDEDGRLRVEGLTDERFFYRLWDAENRVAPISGHVMPDQFRTVHRLKTSLNPHAASSR